MRWLFLGGLGAAVVLLLGSGLVAVLSDSVTSDGNKVESGTLPTHDVQIAIVGAVNECRSASFSDGPAGAAIDLTNVDLTSNANLPRQIVCVKNNGSATGRLMRSFVNVTDVEVGACTVHEATQDSTCADGDDGELEEVLSFLVNAANINNCSALSDPNPSPFGSLIDAELAATDFAPGSICAFLLVPTIVATDDQRLVAQTDRLTWDILFTLEDAL